MLQFDGSAYDGDPIYDTMLLHNVEVLQGRLCVDVHACNCCFCEHYGDGITENTLSLDAIYDHDIGKRDGDKDADVVDEELESLWSAIEAAVRGEYPDCDAWVKVTINARDRYVSAILEDHGAIAETCSLP